MAHCQNKITIEFPIVSVVCSAACADADEHEMLMVSTDTHGQLLLVACKLQCMHVSCAAPEEA